MECNDNSIKPRTCSLVPFNKFLEDIGKSPVTGWRMRQSGIIKTVNVCGKIFVTEEEIRRFEVRAIAGEFTKKATVPCREKRGSS